MRILSWNVNGIRACAGHGFLKWLENDAPDILCVQETKASPRDVAPELRHPFDYKTYWNSAEKKGYSGTAAYVKREPLEWKKGIGLQRFDDQGRALILKYDGFTLVNFYITNGSRDKRDMDFKLSQYEFIYSWLEKMMETEKNIVLCGDFNVAHTELDLARPKQNMNNTMFTPGERKCLDRLTELGFVDVFREQHADGGHYTWWPYLAGARERNVGWRIDYFFASKPFAKHVKNSFILPNVRGSDHCPVGIEFF